ncbi:GspJ family T2SS minor pseudopilin variant LspJ [Legionella fairfieldensis]|uniref:GspJ family T2SS minor pseudopilin variant LspJ n=1 Tax=Legionella fairfieldensis TaxID=45064 RepID=UPI00048B7C70|nr:GspJ family T2SS minor pseudopilin variant LspJ [Legionella fairfieldensis]
MRKQTGFTLIEILIALAVFALVATMTSSVMFYAFNTRARVAEQADQLNDLQLTITRMMQDTEQAVPRPVRGNDMQNFPPFIGESHYFELTRGGLVGTDLEEKRSTMQRIAWVCHNNQLIRRSWANLDTPDRENHDTRIMLDGLTHCQFTYLNHNLQVLSEWRANAIQQNQHAEPLPEAIQIKLTPKHGGKMSFLFIIPGAFYAEK